MQYKMNNKILFNLINVKKEILLNFDIFIFFINNSIYKNNYRFVLKQHLRYKSLICLGFHKNNFSILRMKQIFVKLSANLIFHYTSLTSSNLCIFVNLYISCIHISLVYISKLHLINIFYLIYIFRNVDRNFLCNSVL